MEFELTLKNYRCFADEHPLRLSFGRRFTALVGPNNSGKSTVLRWIYDFRHVFNSFTRPGLLADIGGNTFTPNLNGVLDETSIFCDHADNNRPLSFEISPLNAQPQLGKPPAVPTLLISLSRDKKWSVAVKTSANKIIPADKQWGIKDNVLHMNGQQIGDVSPYHKIFETLSNTLYIGAFRNILSLAPKRDELYYDIDIGTPFVAKWRDLKTGPNKRENELAQRISNTIAQMFGFRSLEINATSDEATLQIVINDKPYRLHEVGGGLAQVIIAIANAATKRSVLSYILIDEPELNLHPSLQLSFLTELAAYASEGIIFSTHSLGLARASAESIYTTRRNSRGASIVTRFEDDKKSYAELAGELSFGAYHVLGFDRILLVEGVTEVKAIQQLLRLYRKEHEVLLIPLGGSSMINGKTQAELDEIRRITPKVTVLIDSERSAKEAALAGDREAFVRACQNLSLSCKVLDRRAFENYFTSEALARAFQKNPPPPLAPYERLEDRSQGGWSKADNWKIAREMQREELDATDLGTFLDSL